MHILARPYAGVPGSRVLARSCAAASTSTEMASPAASWRAVGPVSSTSPRSIAPTSDVDSPVRLPNSGCVRPRMMRQSAGYRSSTGTETTSSIDAPRDATTRARMSTVGVLTPVSQWYSVVNPTRDVRARSWRVKPRPSRSARNASPEKPRRTRRLTPSRLARDNGSRPATLPHLFICVTSGTECTNGIT